MTRHCEAGASGGNYFTAPFLATIRPGGQAGDIKGTAGDRRPPVADLAAPLVAVAERIITPVTALPGQDAGEPCARVGLLRC
ncbi:hypothetical protein [Streptomyces capitiformicae]|uniref:Uncharacterized protein n=1 Tax=Streptomyces capitiformicae TaxID=2014920 RepID=A0A919DPU6_9ACTN|nr:hypothetical protein [Streptomyces capitiformicae]GHE67513.1 hypothetical protein GCM10017771_91290 [Streptomyces capitiformicae]